MSDRLRQRVYRHYVTAWDQAAAPATLEHLAPRAPYLREVVSRYFPANKSAEILDLGCGHGALLHFAHKAGYLAARGIDVSVEQVETAARLGIPGVEQGDLMATLGSLSAESVDLVVAFDVIEHFTKDELVDFIDAVYRVLKPGGAWLIHTPNAGSPFVGAVRYGDITHEQAFTRTSIEQVLRASGFRAVASYECAPVVHGAASRLRGWLWRGVRFALRAIDAIETGDTGRAAIYTRNFLALARK